MPTSGPAPAADSARQAPDRDHFRSGLPLNLMIAGVPVSVDGLADPLRSRAEELLRPFMTETPPGVPAGAPIIVDVDQPPEGSSFAVRHAGHELMSTADPDQLLAYLDWLVVARALEATNRYAAFHCAALARDGGAVLLVAESGAGKTTLTLGLMRRGWEPLGDDIALVDRETLTLAAFPRCFHVDDATTALVAAPEPLDRPGRLDGYARPRRWAEGDLPVRAIAVVERCVTCPSSRTPISQAQAAAALISAAVRNQIPKRDVVRITAKVASGARTCIRLRNGHLDGALNLIESATRG